MKDGVTEGAVNPFDFIFDMGLTGQEAPDAGERNAGTTGEGNGYGNKGINAEAMNAR
ncbi:hypothetical protein [Enterobacter sp.]|uniref:hypothetical protein n=1 Tax=Enterobacter sp. TaxID=42895 RepID=UPI0029821E3B|nr:hypothetical protein [Enterobacter sp.]